jgi:flagellin-like hook-associated protein FlgL
MSNVLLSAGARTALSSLNSIQSEMNVLQKRLATGKRVNSPIDNPSAFFLAASLSGRATTLMSLSEDISTAKSAVSAANNGIATLQSLLSSARSVANTALQSSQSLVTVTGTRSGLTTSDVIASNAGSSTRFRTGDVVTVSDGTTTATYTAANNDDVQDFLSAINNTVGLKVTASLNSSGQIELAATSNINVTIGATVNGAGGATLSSVIGHSTGTTSYITNTTRQNMATQFASLRSQMDSVAADASFNGINLLSGSSLSVSFNETGSSSMTLSGASLDSSGLGISAASNSWQLDSDINTAIGEIEDAITSLQTYAASFSSMSAVVETRSDFNQTMIDTLNAGADTLTINDSNEDSALLLALQTRQQVATTALSLVQSSESAALRLFGLS